MNDNAHKKPVNNRHIGLFLIMALIGGGAGYFVYAWSHRPAGQAQGESKVAKGGETEELTQQQALAAMELKDKSTGHLENGPTKVEVDGKKVNGLDLAADGFERLADQLPAQLLPVQDLAITRLLLLRSAEADVEQAREAARSATKKLIEFAPDSGVGYWLAAQVELHADATHPAAANDSSRSEAVKLLQQATKLDPDNVIFWNALKEAATGHRDTKPNETAKEALEKAYALSPRNIYLLTEMMMMQATSHDPALEKTLESAKQVFQPLAAAFKRRSRLDLNEQIEKAIQGIRDGKWNIALASVRMISNVIRPEEASKSDLGRVDVFPLEFAVYEFSPDFYSKYGHPKPAWDATTPVKLQVTADDVLQQVTDAVDLKVMDFTLNGLPDILVLEPGRLRLFGRDKLDQPWKELASLDVPAGMRGILAADLDRDERKSAAAPSSGGRGNSDVQFDRVISGTAVCHEADPDIVVYGDAGALVIRNDFGKEGDGPKLVPVDNPALQSLSKATCGVLFDLDEDGDLDMAASSAQGLTLWENDGNMVFTDISQFSQLPPADVPLTSMLAVDWDRDADIDLVLGEPSGQVTGWLKNLRHGEFVWTAFDSAYEQLRKPQQLALLEADGNVSWDLLSVGQEGVNLFLTATPRSGLVKFLRSDSINEIPTSGVATWDFDNDGYRDAATWGGGELRILRGGPQAAFTPSQVISGDLPGPVESARCVDIDRDGDQDVVAATKAGISLLINGGGSGNQWLTLYPMGQSDNKGRCNQDAIGSLVELRCGGWYQAQVVATPVVHFGLGGQKTVQQLRIVWTNGIPQDIVNQAGSVAICEPMILKGSCPYVYTLANGQFSFFTDCLWAAPIGMQTSEGTIAPTRSWEYLLIPGERLTPQDGSYWVMMTEELWEAGYFDKVELLAIDHPADVEVYSNEKVGPANIAQFRICTVSQRRHPERAVDQEGRDLKAKLLSRDGDFVKAFDQRIRQGLTPEHYIELDLGPLSNPHEIMLYLTGWIFPTDTSLNVAFAQDPETDGPRMPSVWVPDADGNWQETVAYMGFPGGKTKTIAVDLSHAFLTNDYRVRIKTTAEIYWDEAFFTVDQPPVETRQTSLKLQSADVAYRGFSREIPRPDEAPQMYDAQHVRRVPVWPAMQGKFTRYGSVTDLLAAADDMLVVIGAGDAVTIRFAVPDQPPPEGWKRDFFLHSVGWDKDADLNTIYGQSSEPLPFRAMKSYPFDPQDAVPSSPEYQDYLRRYQTREQDPQAFWRYLNLNAAGAFQ